MPNLSVNRSLGAFSFWAVWMRRMIFCNVLSPGSRVTSKSTAPHRLIVPLNTASPLPFSTGCASPVSADSSLALFPSNTVPSVGNASPGFTRTRTPRRSSSTATSRSLPSASTSTARFGADFNSALTSRWVRSKANASIAPDAENKNNNSTASLHAPIATAPAATINIKK